MREPGLFPTEIVPVAGLFPSAPPSPAPYTVTRCGASFVVSGPDGMTLRSFGGRDGTDRAHGMADELNAAFAAGWAARERAS